MLARLIFLAGYTKTTNLNYQFCPPTTAVGLSGWL